MQLNYSDLSTDEVGQRVEAARRDQGALIPQLAAAKSTVTALEAQLREAQAAIAHGEYVLAWRERAQAARGDIAHALSLLAARSQGATLRQIATDASGYGHATIADATGRTWRVTFDGGVDAYWLPDYSLIPDEQVAGAEIADILWDDQWLIAARLRGADIHVRLFGEPISVEEVMS